ncbi:MAG TPA: c-type cytochrome [Bryobacteraceae bacterium]|nr:c-type cytochrome [Bryobacteraceae bacterium]
MIWVALLLWANSATPQQVQRGDALFAERCAQCHALKGRGTAVGPDLSVMGRLPARAIATAIRSTVTEYVQTVKLISGETFPGMPLAGDDTHTKFFDVSKTPPELRQLDRADIVSTTPNATWKHPPALAGYTDQQVADITAYVRYAVTGTVKPIDPSDVQ